MLVDNPVAVGDAETAPQVNEPEPEPTSQGSPRPGRTTASKPSQSTPTTGDSTTNPYAGMRKVQVPVRLFPPLWDRLEEIVRELRDEGLEVDKTALLNAVLHFDGPRDLERARELVNRWRALLACPPAPPR